MKTLTVIKNKILASDQFDLRVCISGLIYQLMGMSSNAYEFAYYLTFKRSLKEYAMEFNDAFDKIITDPSFFLETGDRIVINCCSVDSKILKCKRELMQRFLIDEMDNCQDKIAIAESKRYAPYRMLYKRSKSYKKLIMYYERSLQEYIEYLYKFACIITASNYRIPLVLKRQFLKEEAVSLRLLNSDDDTVALLMELIISLRVNLATLRDLNANKKKLSN